MYESKQHFGRVNKEAFAGQVVRIVGDDARHSRNEAPQDAIPKGDELQSAQGNKDGEKFGEI